MSFTNGEFIRSSFLTRFSTFPASRALSLISLTEPNFDTIPPRSETALFFGSDKECVDFLNVSSPI
ncbi:hypothetical protein [Aminivibrio sp.]|uniref:hypothetical protein n=1 Tax=Aminivibrio sp. TaxID=1872489 RepID=UPI00345F0B65